MSEVKVDTISERTAAGGVTIDGVLVKDGVATFQTAAGSPLVFEGATADAFETTFAITDPTADRTITFPDSSFTVPSTGGKILQVVQTVKTDTTSTTALTSSPVDMTGMTVDITPSATNSKVLVFWNLSLGFIGNNSLFLTLVREVGGVAATPLLGDTASSRVRTSTSAMAPHGDGPGVSALQYLDSPATTSAVTYKIKWSIQWVGTGYVNRSYNDGDAVTIQRTTSSITVMEIGA